MDAMIAYEYLKGNTIQVLGAPDVWIINGEEVVDEPYWVDIPPYQEPNDIFRLSCSLYSFRVKPKE